MNPAPTCVQVSFLQAFRIIIATEPLCTLTAVYHPQLECPLPRVHMLFRSLGLRHLSVVDRNNVPFGVITRKVW